MASLFGEGAVAVLLRISDATPFSLYPVGYLPIESGKKTTGPGDEPASPC
jgi:hypothetical protein